MSSYLISSTKKSSGKTIVSIGLSKIFSQTYKNISLFKKGPDYIDPLWISEAGKKPCYNLDFNTMTKKEIKLLFHEKSLNSELSLIEANKGLFDGMNLNGNDSNAALADLLSLKIVLVLDCEGMTRGVAPLIQGYENFHSKLNFHGIIFNNVNGSRHEGKLISSVEKYTNMRIVGSIWRDNKLNISEQNLGLEPTFSNKKTSEVIRLIAKTIKSSVDTDSFKKKKISNSKKSKVPATINNSEFSKISIGIPKDAAFGFYYRDDLEKFEQYGVKIKFFSTLKDKQIPKVDALFIGGGFPEHHLQDLSANHLMREDIKNFIQAGKPVYAECGGLMYLSKSITLNKTSHKMVNAIPGNIVLHEKPVGRGYVDMRVSKNHPWLKRDKVIPCHEFHHSKINITQSKSRFAFHINRGYGINKRHDGIIIKNLVASYSHLRDSSKSRWIKPFLKFVRDIKNETKTNI